ncbi:hypothetical protein CC1G_04120 [Coprinopsis cinerea okayama7|uniref:Uncharacterized protein n=1 Tax=Coprinopsis cinerea (strain Okayama-7 / 130 / ATCC MYA-4618 / FGSC 9003) TaxID=240176 RepID=A8NW21_COPC7|nr:hypothetical protein CC1G_04120 [Coprinopsis cinerea okayama7\|eukprot:XP_001836807.1 hypothetical protein CC1G_04120 [Coprinopsis cinerea okayama7\
MSSTLIRRSLQRPVFRQRGVRFSSTNTEAAQKKAQDTLANAQATAEKVWASTLKLLGPIGETAGRMLGSYKQPLLYNLAVARELAKQVYVAERLQPPTLDAVKAAYKSLWSQVSSPAAIRQFAASGQVAQVGVYGLQAYTIFKIGEILGRRSLVGYNIQ